MIIKKDIGEYFSKLNLNEYIYHSVQNGTISNSFYETYHNTGIEIYCLWRFKNSFYLL